MAMLQPMWLREKDVPTLPDGWDAMQISEVTVQLKPGKLFEKKTVGETGLVPVLSQGESGFIGFHDEEPGVVASSHKIVVTFANHTCAMRLMRQPFSCIQNIFSRIGKEGICDTLYFYYAAQGRVNLSDYKGHHPLFRQAYIPIPPLATQRKIAAILSAYDDLIENNLRRIKVLEEMAQNLYREWFVKFQFPGHQHARFTDSPLGRIPEGWEARALADVVKTQYGYTESAQERPIGPKYLRGMDINKTTYIDWDVVPYCPIPDSQLPKYQLAEGDIVIIRMADPGKAGIVERDVNAVFASYLVRFTRTSNRIGPYYLFHFLIDERYQGYITGASTGTTRKSASAGVLAGIDIVIPPESILANFESQVEMLRRLLNNLLERNTTLRRTRDLLLPRLISGEVDVGNFQID